MPEKRARRGDGFLHDATIGDLEALRNAERSHKTKAIMQATTRRKGGMVLDAITGAAGYARSTVYGRLARLQAGGAGRIRDRKSPSRPCRLSGS